MNKNVANLFTIAGKPARLIIGLMSGTSLDGLDVALTKITGAGRQTRVQLLQFETIPYPQEIKEKIKKIFAKTTVDFEQLCITNEWLGSLHASYILDCLKKWNIAPQSIDLIASHGQTVYHSPRIFHKKNDLPNATLQIGDGDHIAVQTGIISICDFRQKHIAAGGEGAPLALYGDYLLFSTAAESRIMLNLGGIANFTFLPSSLLPEAVMVTDTGPGNTLIDAYTQQYFQQDFDSDAALAKQGKINNALLLQLKADAYFESPLPKTTGPELFNLIYLKQAQKQSGTEDINPHDVLATLTKFSADTISGAIHKFITEPGKYTVYSSGGGAHNPLLMQGIKENLPGVSFFVTGDIGIPGDAKEAVLFALLANETVAGGPSHFGKGMPAVTMGKICFPD